MRTHAVVAASAIILAACSVPPPPPPEKPSTCVTFTLDLTAPVGNIFFQLGGKNVSADDTLVVSDVKDGKSIKGKDAQIELVIGETEIIGKKYTRVTNAGREKIVLKTAAGCLHPIASLESITFGERTTKLEISRITK